MFSWFLKLFITPPNHYVAWRISNVCILIVEHGPCVWPWFSWSQSLHKVNPNVLDVIENMNTAMVTGAKRTLWHGKRVTRHTYIILVFVFEPMRQSYRNFNVNWVDISRKIRRHSPLSQIRGSACWRHRESSYSRGSISIGGSGWTRTKRLWRFRTSDRATPRQDFAHFSRILSRGSLTNDECTFWFGYLRW